MTKAEHTRNDGSKGAYDTFTQIDSGTRHNYTRINELKIRHVSAEDRPDRGEHTQVEIWIDEIKGANRRSYKTHGHLTLAPAEAEAMALALLSPEKRRLIAEATGKAA